MGNVHTLVCPEKALAWCYFGALGENILRDKKTK